MGSLLKMAKSYQNVTDKLNSPRCLVSIGYRQKGGGLNSSNRALASGAKATVLKVKHFP